MRTARDLDHAELDAHFPGRAQLRGGLAQLEFDMLHLFIEGLMSPRKDRALVPAHTTRGSEGLLSA